MGDEGNTISRPCIEGVRLVRRRSEGELVEVVLKGKRKERYQEGEVRLSKELEEAEVFKRSRIVARTPEKKGKKTKIEDMIKTVERIMKNRRGPLCENRGGSKDHAGIT